MTKRVIGIFLLLVTLFSLFSACKKTETPDPIGRDSKTAKLYDDVGIYIKTEIKELYQTKQSDNLATLPATYTWIIQTEEKYNLFFENRLPTYSSDTLYVLYTFTCNYILPYCITDLEITGNRAIIEYALIDRDSGRGSATIPFQRWFVVELKKTIISNALLVEKDYQIQKEVQ